MNKIYNIPLSCSFVDNLAKHFLQEYRSHILDLAEVTFLLPNNRACQTLKSAFIRLNGMHPTLLPKMKAIADMADDELLLSSPEVAQNIIDLPPAISPQMRQMLFIKIIMSKPAEFGIEKISLNQAAFLASDLGNLIDTSHNLQLDFANLEHLAPEEYASHWQETLKFLKIITAYWPDILSEQNLCDAAWRKNKLIDIQCDAWKKSPPENKIVIAGTSAAFPTMKKLVQTVASLPNGEVYLHGLDKHLDDSSWKMIDETHPQYELKELLDFLQMNRHDIPDFSQSENPHKENLISEIMRPAHSTDSWRKIDIKNIDLSNISFINTSDIRQEAIAIAIKMREVLEEPEKTVALITSDRNLSRRVASELARWGIKIDDSAGKPLLQTPPAIFMRQILAVAQNKFSATDILSLLKHPLCRCGIETSKIRKLTRDYEYFVLRKKQNLQELNDFSEQIKTILQPLQEEISKQETSLSDIIQIHIKTTETLAADINKSGEENLWKGENGKALASFFSDILGAAHILDKISPQEYAGLLDSLLSGHIVHSNFGTHPRLKILGPIEAKLQHFDVTIIGETNEGTWPVSTSSDMWMSRPMKKDFGFPLPERSIGVSANNFSELFCAPKIILSRAERVMGTPMVKSRWVLRFETILKALNISPDSLLETNICNWTNKLDSPKEFNFITPPAPRPPLSSRPRSLSVSAIELWMRDPYSLFAKYILKLKPLEELDADLTLADYGNIVHSCLEEFNNRYPHQYPNNAKEELLKIGKKYFMEQQISSDKLAFWLPKYNNTIDWLISVEQKYRSNIKRVHNEVCGEYSFNSAGGDFTIKAKADRIDENLDGSLNILDYKTGKARSSKEVSAGFAPQLPLEGLIASQGGFKNIKAAEVQHLIYWQLGKKVTDIDKNIDEIINKNFTNLQSLISAFDFESTAYICHPNPKKIPEYSDYEHLARVKEWSTSGDNND